MKKKNILFSIAAIGLSTLALASCSLNNEKTFTTKPSGSESSVVPEEPSSSNEISIPSLTPENKPIESVPTSSNDSDIKELSNYFQTVTNDTPATEVLTKLANYSISQVQEAYSNVDNPSTSLNDLINALVNQNHYKLTYKLEYFNYSFTTENESEDTQLGISFGHSSYNPIPTGAEPIDSNSSHSFGSSPSHGTNSSSGTSIGSASGGSSGSSSSSSSGQSSGTSESHGTSSSSGTSESYGTNSSFGSSISEEGPYFYSFKIDDISKPLEFNFVNYQTSINLLEELKTCFENAKIANDVKITTSELPSFSNYVSEVRPHFNDDNLSIPEGAQTVYCSDYIKIKVIEHRFSKDVEYYVSVPTVKNIVYSNETTKEELNPIIECNIENSTFEQSFDLELSFSTYEGMMSAINELKDFNLPTYFHFSSLTSISFDD